MRSLTIFILFVTIALSIASKLKDGQNMNALRTCFNERLEGSFLSATCKRINDNTMQNTSVNLNTCLGNINGRLSRGRDFLSSCRDCRLGDDTIYCECKRRDGTWEDISSMKINSFVGNDNGKLRC
jgi:hypothetical protein